ncbi:uncharacterized protein SCHCODRAFT_02672676 [Schizophyllum commune H4-8]|nr:uncharacterized protein SCHCODRAFT_02672676 [Schizophyllum commune H4-8]KAI5886468.1 hypothetical protein SCHCODRAFT_02672676 [Schizophyllum commune H4-8]
MLYTLVTIPLINKLEINETHLKALQQVFSKDRIHHTLKDAAVYVKALGITIITTDSDKVDRKDALFDGYHEPGACGSTRERVKNMTTMIDQ